MRLRPTVFALVCFGTGLTAQEHLGWPAGDLFVCGGGTMPDDVMQAFVERAGGAAARLVVIPTASAGADAADAATRYLEPWRARGVTTSTLLHTRARGEADDAAFCAPLDAATAVWISGGDQTDLAAAYVGTRVERALHALLARGGVVGGTSAGAAIQSRRMIAGGNPEPRLAFGLGLVDRLIVDQHFTQRHREARLVRALVDAPGEFGVGVDENTALWIRGRRAQVLGDGAVTVVFGATASAEPLLVPHTRGAVLDLEQQRRIAATRCVAQEPVADDATVAGPGTLVIVGGGIVPDDAVDAFVRAAGGTDAPIVVVPTASWTFGDGGAAATERAASAAVAMFARRGCRRVQIWHEPALRGTHDERLLRPLHRARGVWFCGGRQDRLVDAYEGTSAIAAFHAVLTRGGVIGGSSAGASIQAELLVRGDPQGNTVLLSAGYLRGFGFLRGAAIDQHFTQRRRAPDLRAVVTAEPRALGLGIDEGTALVVTGAHARVVGAGSVTVLDGRGGAEVREAVIPAGGAFELGRSR